MVASPRAKRVLLVDDDPLVRRALGAVLRHLGCEVVVFANPEEALQAVADGAELDVLVTDQEMPEMKGTALSERVRKLRPSIRIVLCSGSHRPTDEELERHGIDAMLTKPVSQSALAIALDGPSVLRR